VGAIEYVAAVDRLLTRAHQLFPVPAGADDFVASTSPTTVAEPPPSVSTLTSNARLAGATYEHAHTAIAGLDRESSQAAAQGTTIGAQGHTTSGLIRDGARLHAQALMPMTKSPAGLQLLVATMDQHLSAMQRQLDTTTAQYRVLAARLRQTAADYRAAAGLTDRSTTNTAVEQTYRDARNDTHFVDFKQDGPTPAPLPPPTQPIPAPPPSIKITPHPTPPTVIAMEPPPDDPPQHHCGPAEIAKDTTIAVGGAAGIGSGLAGEIPTLGAASAAILAGIGALWDGMDKLGECK
jgi:hypothetical protein